MPTTFPFDPPDRCEYSDEFYSSIGRVLSLAQSFEGKVKALAALIKIKTGPNTLFDHSKNYERVVSKIYKNKTLFQNLENTCRVLGFKEEIKATLTEAREMRNFVAHDLAVVVREDDDGRYITESVRKAAVSLATGDILVATLLNLIGGTEVLNEGAGARIRDSIVEWVCETYAQ